MSKAKAVSEAGRRRLESALEAYGMLPVQGQHEIPSIADLLEGAPIRTRGFSWDYVPAWDMSEELVVGEHKAMTKLFRGANTVVDRQHWHALHTLAEYNVAACLEGRVGDHERDMLAVVAENKGIPGETVRQMLDLEDTAGRRQFQRTRRRLEILCAISGEERSDVDYHTHDREWYAWGRSKVAQASEGADAISIEEAKEHFLRLVREIGRGAKPETLFPVLGPAMKEGRK